MPTLTYEALKQQVASRALAPLYLFAGDDVQLMSRMVDAVEATVEADDRVFAVERVHAGDPGGHPVDIVAAARTLPMLGDRRIVVVLRAERLLKPKRAGRPADDEEESPSDEAEGPVDAGPLEDYIAAPSPSTTVVFVAADVDRTRRLTKRLIEKALVTVFDGNELDSPRGDARANLANVLRGTLAREGRSIDRDAGAMLVNRAGGDVSKLRDDIERLVLFVGDRKRITEDDVMEVAADRGGSDDVWAVVNAIAAGDAATALREMARRLDQGDSPHAVVGQLRWWVSAKLAAADARRVKPALDAVLRTDMALKGSGLDKRVLVERLVVELTGRPIASSRWEGREGGSRRT